MAITDNKRGVRIGLGRRINYPTQLPNLAAWYDVGDRSSMTIDGSNRVQLIGDKSGNSSENVLALNGVAGNYATVPNAVPVQASTEIEIVARASCVWSDANDYAFAAKYGAAAARSFIFRKGASGVLSFSISSDGTNITTAVSSANVAFADYATGWVKVTWRASDGRTQFFTAADSSTEPIFTQLGTNQTVSSGANIFNSSAVLEFGARSTGAINVLSGNLYEVIFRKAISGTADCNPKFTGAAKLATSFTESSSNAATVTINTTGDLGARICGARDLYQGTASKQPIYLPFSGTNYGWINDNVGSFSTPLPSLMNPLSLDVAIWVDNCRPSSTRQLAQVAGSFIFAIQSNGYLRTRFNSSAGSNSTSTVVTTNVSQYVRFTYDGANVKFYTSPDGTTWTQLGTDVAEVITVNAFAAVLYVGLGGNLAIGWSGVIRRAVFRASIDGSIVYDFNPALYTNGATFTASTGETWTLNGGSTIVTRTCLYFDGTDDYMKAASFSLSQPVSVYGVLSQVSWTNGEGIYDGNASASMRLYQAGGVSPNLYINAGSDLELTDDLAIATAGVITSIFNGASSSVRKNRGVASVGNAGSTASNGFTLGARGDISSYSNITTSEIIVYAATQDQNTQNLIITYLGMVWKILLG